MIAAAVTAHIRESADLDWKLVVIPASEMSGPGEGKAIEEQRWEFAKDVTAMANTQGGLIVYGVQDVQEEARGVEHVPLGERERQQSGSWANTLIRPWLKGLVIEEFPTREDSSRGSWWRWCRPAWTRYTLSKTATGVESIPRQRAHVVDERVPGRDRVPYPVRAAGRQRRRSG